jgi:hypothetical protein
MVRLVRDVRGESMAARGWTRCTFLDLCAIRVIIDLFGGPSSLRAGGRLQLGALRTTCMRLRDMGFSNPLLQVKLVRTGAKIVAQANGIQFEPATGQLLLDALYDHAAEAAGGKPNEVRRALKRERSEVKRIAPARVSKSRYLVPVHGARR